MKHCSGWRDAERYHGSTVLISRGATAELLTKRYRRLTMLSYCQWYKLNACHGCIIDTIPQWHLKRARHS